MKKIICTYFILMAAYTIESQTDLYNNGNGTFLENRIVNNIKYSVKKHETKNITIGRRIYVYEDFGTINGKIIFTLVEEMKISSILIAIPENTSKIPWLQIDYNGKTGWIECMFPGNPYQNDNWSIIETINIKGKSLTVRKLNQNLLTTKKMNVRDQPGLESNILFQIDPWDFFEMLAITEETETIDGKTDHWLKILDRQGRTGWLFGGYTSAERGGPTYLIPEEIIKDDLSRP